MPETIGQRLKRERQARQLSLEEVARATHLRPRYLEAIEADDLSALPSAVQARAFLLIYAKYLGIHPDEFTHSFSAPESATKSIPPQRENAFRSSLLGFFKLCFRKKTSVPAVEDKTASVSSEASFPSDDELPLQELRLDEVSPVLPSDSPTTPPSSEIFRSIGESLRQRREILSLTWEEISRHIHLRPPSLRLLEAGDFDAFPSSVQVQGMLSSYARFLGLDEEAILLRFAEGLQQKRSERLSKVQKPLKRPSFPRGGLISADLVVGGLVILGLIGLAVWGVEYVNQLNRSRHPSPTLPSISEVLLTPPAAVGGASLPKAPDLVTSQAEGVEAATIAPVVTSSLSDPVQIVITVLHRTWLRVSVDGRVRQEGRVLAGEVYTFGGKERIELLAANGAAIRILYNQVDIGVAGSMGEVVNLIFISSGMHTPTPTATSIPSPSPSPTMTPRATPTSRN